MNPLHDDVFAIAIAIAKQCFNGFFSLCDDRFPASGTNFGFTTISKQLIGRFQNGCQLKKMAHHCFLGWIPRFTGTKNGRRMEDLRWTSRYSARWNALNSFQCVSMGFFILFDYVFALQQFRWNKLTSSSKAPLYTNI